MALEFGDRVKETTTTTGTGTLDLAGAATGYLAFSDEVSNGSEVPYLIVDDPDAPTAWELGVGTLTTGSPDTLSRDTVLRSTNSNNKVSFSAGTKTVILPLPSAYFDPSQIGDTVGSTTNMAIGPGTIIPVSGTNSIETITGYPVNKRFTIIATGAWTLVADGDNIINRLASSYTVAAGQAIEFYAHAADKCTVIGGHPQIASEATAEAGTNNALMMTPLRTGQVISNMTKVTTSNQVVTSSSFADITGLTASVLNGETWAFEATINFDIGASSTVGRVSVNGPTASTIEYTRTYLRNDNTVSETAITTSYDDDGGTLTTSTAGKLWMTGRIVATGDGTLAMRVRRSAGSGNVNIVRSSMLRAWRVQ